MNTAELQQLLEEYRKDIPRLYADAPRDYRGRKITSQHVQEYLTCESRRFCEVAQLLPPPPHPESRLLEIGIAYGFLTALIQDSTTWKCEGLEIADNIPIYCHFAKNRGLPVHAGRLGLSPLPLEDESYDAILFSEVLEHLRLSPTLVFPEINRLLSPGGVLLLTTPNIARLTNLLKLFAGRNIVENFPHDVRSENITDHLVHIREYTMEELVQLLTQYDFEILTKRYSSCMERNRPHAFLTALYPPWRGDLMVVARKKS